MGKKLPFATGFRREIGERECGRESNTVDGKPKPVLDPYLDDVFTIFIIYQRMKTSHVAKYVILKNIYYLLWITFNQHRPIYSLGILILNITWTIVLIFEKF